MKISLLSCFCLLISMSACAANQIRSDVSRNGASTILNSPQFFQGNVQRTSLDGKTPYGPAFSSVVRRFINQESGQITECVFQEGKVFVSWMTPTQNPLVYAASDSGNSFSGELIFLNETLSSWSYNIQVSKPSNGKITGNLADGNGAKINSNGEMTITKIWNNQVRIHEQYSSFTENEYLIFFRQQPETIKTEVVLRSCQ